MKAGRFVVFVLALPPLAAQRPCAPPPLPDWLLPSEENYQTLRDPGQRKDIFDRLHYLPLGSETSGRYLSLGGQQREWFESFSTAPFGNGPGGSNSYLLQRYMLHFDLRLSDRVRIFVEVKGDLENGRAGGPRPDIDEDRGDFNQAFLELTLIKRRGHRLSLRLGRREMVFGSGRLVDMREGPNVRRGSDGAKLTYCAAGWNVAAFAARPVLNRAAAFDDVPGHATSLAGLYATRALPAINHANLDGYYFFFDQKQSRYAAGLAREQRHTIGTRFWKFNRGGWDYDWEALSQFGRFGARGIEAWGISENTGYTFAKAPWKPRAGFKTGIASGDSGASKRDLGTLNPLFASLHYFGEEGLAGPANFFDVRPELELHPAQKIRVLVGSDWYWRHRLTDGIYLPGPILLVGPGNSTARYIGNQTAVEAEWNPAAHWTVTG